MVDGTMPMGDSVIGRVLIGADDGARADVLMDDRLDGVTDGVWDVLSYRLAAVLPHPEYGLLPLPSPVLVQSLIRVLVFFLAADVGFVHLDDPEQFSVTATTGFTDAL